MCFALLSVVSTLLLLPVTSFPFLQGLLAYCSTDMQDYKSWYSTQHATQSTRNKKWEIKLTNEKHIASKNKLKSTKWQILEKWRVFVAFEQTLLEKCPLLMTYQDEQWITHVGCELDVTNWYLLYVTVTAWSGKIYELKDWLIEDICLGYVLELV